MIKSIILGLWSCAVLIAASYATGYVREHRTADNTERTQKDFETKTTREISVPAVRHGAVEGYIVVKLSFVANKAKATESGLAPDAFVEDETFKYIYGNDAISPERLDKVDLKQMTRSIIDGTNKRMGGEVLADIGIQEFTYMASNETKARN